MNEKAKAPDGVIPASAFAVLWFLYEEKVSCCALGLVELFQWHRL